MSRITLPQIEAFYWTVTLGSVQKAADRLTLSQPAISLRLKEFETNIGRPVFERQGRTLKPARQTQELLDSARKVLDAVDGLGSAATSNIGGVVKVGFAEGFALASLPQIVNRLHRLYPAVHPELTIAMSSTIEPALYDGRIDLSFLAEPREVEGFTYVYLGLNPTSWAAASTSDLANPVTPNMLAKLRIISNQPGTIGYRQVVRWFAAEGLTPTSMDICSSVATQQKLIEAGTGVGILPVRMIEEGVASGRLRLLDSVPHVQPVGIFLVHRSGLLTPADRALIECVNETLAEKPYLL